MSTFNTRSRKQHLVRPDAAAELASLPATDLAAKWDKASKLQRCDILATFVERFHACTAAEIERFFGSGAQLFFARLTATMRLSYKTMAASCDRFGILLLMAVGLFLQGQRFLTSFAEIGGIQLLCDFVASIPNCAQPNHNSADGDGAAAGTTTRQQIQRAPQATVEAAAKTRGIRLLIHIANSGRVYREMVCEDGGLQHLVNATAFETDDSVLELMGSLFLSLGHGNPRRVRDVHAALLHIARTGNDSSALCAASTLRALQVARIGPVGVAASATEPSIGMILPDGGGMSSSRSAAAATAGGGRSSNRTGVDRQSVGLVVSEEIDFSTQPNSGRESAIASTNNQQQHQQHHPHPVLAAAHVSPILLASPSASATANAAAEQEAGLVLYMDSLFHLLRSPSIRVRFEGIELLALSAPGHGMLSPMLKRCVDILDDVDTTLHAIAALPYERERAFIHLHASCVRLLFALLTHKDERVASETLRIFEVRLLHLSLGRFMRVTQDQHNKSMLSQSLKHTLMAHQQQAAANNNTRGAAASATFNSPGFLMRNTAAPTAAPGVQDAVRIFKALLCGDGISENVLALEHGDRVRRTVEAWLRKTLVRDELFAPLLDPASSLNDPYVIEITQCLEEANRAELAKNEELEREQAQREEHEQKNEG